MDSNLVKYLTAAIKKDKTKSEIQAEVSSGFEQITTNLNSSRSQLANINIELKNITASQILLAIGGLITILGGVIYITINWQEWNNLARILAIFIPMFIAYGTGILIWIKKNYQLQATAFIVTGALLFPLFLYICFKELQILNQPKPFELGFIISILTLIFYLLQSFYFRFNIWSLISSMTGLITYYFGIKLFFPTLQTNDYFTGWSFLLIGSLYLILGIYYTKYNLLERGRYPFLVGVATVIFSILYLLGNSFDKAAVAWFLFLPSIIYFLVAIYLEKNNQLENSKVIYFLSLFTFLLTLGRLAITDNLLGFIYSNPVEDEITKGSSIFIAGVIYLGVKYGLVYLQSFGLSLPLKFAPVFESIGTLGILGGLYYMSLGGKKFVLESLVLLLSLSFIFGSIQAKSRAFLYFGTLFLIIYIFDIGGEYFQNQVGWPITLFVAGLVSMGIGFGIERFRRQYFK